MADWKQTLEKLAPTVASALLGPMGGIAVQAIGSILGIDDATQDKIKAAVEAGSLTPEHIAEIKKLELQYQENEKERGFRYAELAFKDIDSARQREIAVKDDTPKKLAFTVIGGFLGISILQLIALMFFPVQAAAIPPQGWLLIGNISGYLAAEAKQAGAYYFGNSAGQEQATKLLSQAPAIEK